MITRQSQAAIAAFSLWASSFSFSNIASNSVVASPLSSVPVIAREKGTCSVNLTRQIDQLLARPDLAIAHWGVIIQNAATQEILYQHNADQLFTPASNLKLLTTAAALLSLGEKYQFKTPFYGQGQAPNLEQLTVVAQGDPTLTSEQLTAIAVQLKNQGIQTIQKLVVVDDIAPQNWLNSTWEWEDIHYDYASPLNRAILNQNTVNLTLKATTLGQPTEVIWSDPIAAKQWQVINQSRVVSGTPQQPIQIRGLLTENVLIITGELAIATEEANGIAIPNPHLYFLQSLEQVLTEQGIQVKEQAMVDSFSVKNGELSLGEIASSPLSEIIKTTNQDSNNFYAEALLNLLKNQENSPPEPVKTIFKKLDLNPDLLILKDGSGLSRQNLVSPRFFNQVLLQLAPNQTYRQSLAIAGETGTLKNRFIDTTLAGKIQGKTGTLTGVSSLSGYLNTGNKQTLVFSILVNNANLPNSTLRETIDQILLLTEKTPACLSRLPGQLPLSATRLRDVNPFLN